MDCYFSRNKARDDGRRVVLSAVEWRRFVLEELVLVPAELVEHRQH